MATTLADIHPDLIQTHILPLLDGPSLSSTATASSHLQTLCSDDNLWSHICNSTWPSTTHPRLHDVISSFPAGHRSFFRDSYPSLVTDVAGHRHNRRHLHHPCPSEIVSAVDIRYQNDVIYSKVEFTDTTGDGFLSSELRIRLIEDPESKHGPGTFRSINGELAFADEAILSHLEESLSLNWILIDPICKRAGNISSIKPVGSRKGWMNGDIYLLYATVLPWSDENTMVQCRIQVVVGVDAGGRLQVKEVMLELLDMDFCRVKGRDFLVITQGALLGESNVKRKMVDVEENRRRYREFKRISVNSLSNLKTEIPVMPLSSHCFLEKLFRFLKLKFSLKTFNFLYINS